MIESRVPGFTIGKGANGEVESLGDEVAVRPVSVGLGVLVKKPHVDP